MKRKGIILAGGLGSRLYPITFGVSKQLLPIYNKPMIYYPLSTLMLAGIREVAIITNPNDLDQYKAVLGNVSQWGMEFTFFQQHSPEGIAQAYLLTKDYLNGAPSTLILGDNIFLGDGLVSVIRASIDKTNEATVFGYRVREPSRYGVIGFDKNQKVSSIVEKPSKPASKFAVTGLYFLNGDAPSIAKTLVPSSRGELEITDLLDVYLNENLLNVEFLGRGIAWFDAGTHSSLLQAGNYVRTLEERQGLQSGSPDEIAFVSGWISKEELIERAKIFSKTNYGEYLVSLTEGLVTSPG